MSSDIFKRKGRGYLLVCPGQNSLYTHSFVAALPGKPKPHTITAHRTSIIPKLQRQAEHVFCQLFIYKQRLKALEQVKSVAEDFQAQEDPKSLPKEEETHLSWGASLKHAQSFTPQSISLPAFKIQAAAL